MHGRADRNELGNFFWNGTKRVPVPKVIGPDGVSYAVLIKNFRRPGMCISAYKDAVHARAAAVLRDCLETDLGANEQQTARTVDEMSAAMMEASMVSSHIIRSVGSEFVLTHPTGSTTVDPLRRERGSGKTGKKRNEGVERSTKTTRRRRLRRLLRRRNTTLLMLI